MTFVPKTFVCLAQIRSVKAIIVKLTVAPPSNCMLTTYKDELSALQYRQFYIRKLMSTCNYHGFMAIIQDNVH